MKPENLEAIYELSPMQQGMLFDSIYAPNSGVYCIHIRFSLQGELNISAFKRAWKQAINLYPVLRTSFYWEGIDKFLQVVHKQVDLPLEQLDWRDLLEAEQEQKLQTFLKADSHRGFELTEAPLMRLILIQMSDTSYQFVFSYHHLIMDGWSTTILFKDFFSLYKAYCQGQSLRLAPSRPYSEYIGWLQQQDLSKAEAFWRQRLEDFTTPTVLGVDTVSVDSLDQDQDFLEDEAYLSAELTAVVQKFARQHQLTLNTLLQGAWSLLLSRYSGEKDVVYGTVISGRPPELAGSDSMVGLFINTLPVRVQMSSDEPLLPWLKSLQNQQLEVRQYEYSPLVQIHEWSGVSGRQPLFESIVVFENYPTDTSSSENEALQISEVQVTDRVTFPLSLWSRIPTGQEAEMSLLLRYNSHRFDSETIKLMLGHLQSLLAGFAANPDQTLADLSLLTEVERRRLLVDWNDTALDYPKDQGLHHLFEAQVKKTPTATAVTFEGKPYSYQVLNERANQLAHYLRSLGVGPEKLVGIYVERSFEMIVGLLGILKAGGAYVPMDPTFPEDRLAYMLANSETAVLLTQESLSDAGFIEQGEVDVVCLDKDWQFIAEQSVDNLTHEFKPHNLAYVIYTSGSTGKPKGVQIHHQAAVNFLYSMQKEPGLKADDVLLAITTISFDISVLEIYLPLINGAHVVLANREQSSDGQLLAKLIKDSKSTIVQATPATWKLLLAVGWEGGQGLKLLCGGEAMSRDLAKQLLPKVKELWNVYGPTETTVWSTVHRVTAVSNQISIGRPIANTQIYLLDERMQPVPTGVPGEMYIGGDGVSRGYLNRPELTAERFIPDPFSTDPNAILYKTGDAARYLPDGNIIFIGRLDFQVKIRGFRIELGEIEAVITTHDAISEVIVIVREDDPGDKRLVAYIISHDTNNPPEISAIQDFARKQLPAYMVPTAYVFLDSFPKTPNRKIDRKSLPAPDQSRPDIGDQYEPPQTDTQKSLEAIWCELLKTDKVGIQDNFFTLGGHSLLATRLLVRINDLMKVDISLRSFFEAPTIASLSEQIDTLHWLSQAPDSEFDTSEDREELEI